MVMEPVLRFLSLSCKMARQFPGVFRSRSTTVKSCPPSPTMTMPLRTWLYSIDATGANLLGDGAPGTAPIRIQTINPAKTAGTEKRKGSDPERPVGAEGPGPFELVNTGLVPQ